MILLRHGQSKFNVHFSATRSDPGIHDAELTPLGHAQAECVARNLAREGIERILVSPYTRALQTAAPIARALGAPVVVNPIVRERCAFSCDVGTPATELARRWPEHDFSTLDEIWWPADEEPAAGVIARAALFRAEIAALPDWSRTLVVSHWGFILSFTGRSVMNGEWIRSDPTAPAPADVIWRT